MSNKIHNDAANYVDEALNGLRLAYPSYVLGGENSRVVTRSDGPSMGRVGIATGGGFGHFPLFAGYVGRGLVTACSVGEVFAGPTVGACTDAIKSADSGAGVLCLLGNYGGDRMNFGLACDAVEEQGTATETVLMTDDIASAPFEDRHKRRGVAGLIYAYKIAGAMAESGAGLKDVAAVARKVVDRCRTIGVALSPCTIPGARSPNFEVSDGDIEIGMGIHGEPGTIRRKLVSADETAGLMMAELLKENPAQDSDRIAVMVNSLGATPMEELFIVYSSVATLLQRNGYSVIRTHVGHYATSMEMTGFSISLLYLDDELEQGLLAAADCPFWSNQ